MEIFGATHLGAKRPPAGKPVKKTINDVVSAGTLNKTGTVIFKATHVGSNTALARIIKMVREAQNSKPPIGQLVDAIAAVFIKPISPHFAAA